MTTLKETITLLFSELDDNDLKHEFFHSEFNDKINKWDEDNHIKFKEELKTLGIKVEHIDNYGGEGQGEEYWSVYSFTKGNDVVYIKFNGYYYSYDGATYNELFFVEPHKVEVTQFFQIKSSKGNIL